MATDPEHQSRTRLARWVLASVVVCAVALTVPEVLAWPSPRRWQHTLGLGLTLVFLATCGAAYRRAGAGDPSRAMEVTYVAALALLLTIGCLFDQPLLLLGCATALLILATAPRIFPPRRVDRWFLAAVFGAFALGALELVPVPTRLPAAPAGPTRDLVFLAALLGGGALAIHDFPRYSLRLKLTLATLLIALAPLVAVRVDGHLRRAAQDLELALSDMSDRAARSAGAWDEFLARQRAPLSTLASGDDAIAACTGDDLRRIDLGRQLRRWTEPGGLVRAAGLWGGVGQRLVAIGEFPTSSPPGGAVAVVFDPGGRDVLVLSAPVRRDDGQIVGTLAVALRPGLLGDWSRGAAIEAGAAVIVRDREDRVLFASEPGVADILPGYAAVPLEQPPDGQLPRLPRASAQDTLTRRLGDDGRLVSVARIGLADWTLALTRDPAGLAAFAPERDRGQRWIALLVAALASIGAFALSRRLAAPIARLAAAMARFHHGAADVSPGFTGSDEIGALARRFDLMAEQVGGLVRSLEQQTRRLQAEVAERSEQESRLQALNHELSSASDQAQAANRAKSTFLAHMSHELRTPLTAIIGYAEMLRDQAHDNHHHETASDADNIVQSAQHLLTIINEILDLSKIEAGKMDMVLEEFDAARLVREVADVVRPMIAGNRNQLRVEIADDPAPMYNDRLKLRQALLNLLGNAAKFTEDGQVVLGLRQASAAGIICLVFTVRDTGPGIPEAALPGLFDPFTQVAGAARKTAGTGLGLAITRRFCRLMGGEIAVTSATGVGSIFTITVPVSYRGIRESSSWRAHRSPMKMDETARIKP